MVVCTLRTLWLTLASDPTQSRSFTYMTGLSSTPTVQVSTRLYAGGNYRQVTMKGRQSGLPVTLTACTAEDRQVIEFDWLGKLLCVRDDRGRKFYGSYGQPQIAEHPYNGECDITVTFVETTVSEAV